MADAQDATDESYAIARRWCEAKGVGWSIVCPLGKGGTAPVFEVQTPDGARALKIYDAEFSADVRGEIERRRIEQQLGLMGHDCPFLVEVFDGGWFDSRLFLLMSRAPGRELEKRLAEIPRGKIRRVIDQVARAAIFLREKGLCHRDIKAANVFISDDFEHCTLLDISVIREVSDPIGVGTDHDGQLPIVATARYSPPEYLFRLLEPTPELWHALTVYQLGALLYDLIMRVPLFQAEYATSKENRYRFAWVIATTEPSLNVEDIDRDLKLIARRALDKDWQRRSVLKLEDFLEDTSVRQANALQVLGIGIPKPTAKDAGDLTTILQRIRDVGADLKDRVVQYLGYQGVRVVHEIQPGANDRAKLLSFRWDTPSPDAQHIELYLDLCLLAYSQGDRFALTERLTLRAVDKVSTVTLTVPELRDGPGVEASLFECAVAGFERLAVEISRAGSVEEEL